MSADVAAVVGVPSSLDFGVSRAGCVRVSCGRALKSCRAQWAWGRSPALPLASGWLWTSGSASLGSIFSFVRWGDGNSCNDASCKRGDPRARYGKVGTHAGASECRVKPGCSWGRGEGERQGERTGAPCLFDVKGKDTDRNLSPTG